MRSSSPGERVRARRILTKPRPSAARIGDSGSPDWLALDAKKRERDTRHSELVHDPVKTESDIEFLVHLIGKYHSIEYATSVGSGKAAEAKSDLDELAGTVGPSVHLDFVHGLVNYVVERQK